MGPLEMYAFSCACRRALVPVNEKLDTPEGRKEYPIESCISRTGAFIRAGRSDYERLLAQNGTTSACWDPGVVLNDGDDPDI